MRNVNPKNRARLESNDKNNKSAVVKHVYSQNHHVDWNNSKILEKETDYTKRRLLESFFIHLNNHGFNDKTNCFYPTAYHHFKTIEIRYMSVLFFRTTMISLPMMFMFHLIS